MPRASGSATSDATDPVDPDVDAGTASDAADPESIVMGRVYRPSAPASRSVRKYPDGVVRLRYEVAK